MDESLGVVLIGLFLDVTEVVCLGSLVAQALLMGVEHYVVGGDEDVALLGEIYYLGGVAQLMEGLALSQSLGYGEGDLLTHAVGDHIGT